MSRICCSINLWQVCHHWLEGQGLPESSTWLPLLFWGSSILGVPLLFLHWATNWTRWSSRTPPGLKFYGSSHLYWSISQPAKLIVDQVIYWSTTERTMPWVVSRGSCPQGIKTAFGESGRCVHMAPLLLTTSKEFSVAAVPSERMHNHFWRNFGATPCKTVCRTQWGTIWISQTQPQVNSIVECHPIWNSSEEIAKTMRDTCNPTTKDNKSADKLGNET